MRHFQHHHRAHGRQRARKELRSIYDKRRFEQVRSTHADIQTPMHERLDQPGQDGYMCIQLDLPGHIEYYQIVLCNLLQRISQEVEVLHQELETIYQPAIGSKLHFLHDIFEADQVFDVEVGLEGEVFGGGVEVHVEARALAVLEVLDEGGAEGGFAGTFAVSANVAD
jgi:hypothetical protein